MSAKELPRVDLPPDPVIEAYKKDIDRTLLVENLKLTPGQRLERMRDFAEAMRLTRGAIAELEVLLEEQRRER